MQQKLAKNSLEKKLHRKPLSLWVTQGFFLLIIMIMLCVMIFLGESQGLQIYAPGLVIISPLILLVIGIQRKKLWARWMSLTIFVLFLYGGVHALLVGIQIGPDFNYSNAGQQYGARLFSIITFIFSVFLAPPLLTSKKVENYFNEDITKKN